MMVLNILLYLLVAVLTSLFLFYCYVQSSYKHWTHRGVPHVKPTFPFGNIGDVIMARKSLIDVTIEQYQQFEGERYFGIWNLNKPALVLRDPSLIEAVLISDFTNFCDRVDAVTTVSGIFGYTLGNLQGEMWRQLRQKLNVAFSNSKLKRMTEQISKCGDSLVVNVRSHVAKKESMMAGCLAYLFSQRVIASCVFGIEYDGVGMQTFMRHAKMMVFNMKVVHLLNLWNYYVPHFTMLLYLIPAVSKVVEYFKNLTEATIQVRKNCHTSRNDFLQVLLDLRDEILVEDNDKNVTKPKGIKLKSDKNNLIGKVENPSYSYKKESIEICDSCITSQLFNFLSLGMELSAVAVAFIVGDLAEHPEVQAKVQRELDAIIAKFGDLTFDALQQLHYLDMVIQESLRLRPGTAYLSRVCQGPYRLPGTDLVLEKGAVVLVPVCAVHLDPANYPEPDRFLPERFVGNHYKPNATYLPLGAGPRMCVASKLVILQLKVAVAKMMVSHSVRLNAKTELPYRYAAQFMPKMLNGVWVDFEPRSVPTSQV